MRPALTFQCESEDKERLKSSIVIVDQVIEHTTTDFYIYRAMYRVTNRFDLSSRSGRRLRESVKTSSKKECLH